MNGYAKDAEAAGKYAAAYINPRRKGDFGASVDVIYTLAKWAGHWGRKHIENNSTSNIGK